MDTFERTEQLRYLRAQIPSFDCVPGCHDCCGPVTASSIEVARLPRISRAKREEAMAAYHCPHLGERGCTVYQERPLICRLFGTTSRLPCPQGKRPEQMIDPHLERCIEQFFVQLRPVLL